MVVDLLERKSADWQATVEDIRIHVLLRHAPDFYAVLPNRPREQRMPTRPALRWSRTARRPLSSAWRS